MRVFDLTIRSLVDENYVYARALSYLGVDFYLYPDQKVFCTCFGVDVYEVEDKLVSEGEYAKTL